MSSRGRLNILGEEDSDDPILSVVNLIDVFLVIIAVLLIVIVENPLNPFSDDNVTVVKNPGQPNMEIIIKEGEELTEYRSSGDFGEGQGVRAGITYRMDDGTMIYVPESGEEAGQ